jgi:hypothetical protein
MFNRKEKEKEFFTAHLDVFRILKQPDPLFAVKTAFYQKGKYGRQVQLFEGELKKGEDIYIEFIDVVRDDNGREHDLTPMFADRQLFKYKYNPFFAEEYEVKEGTNSKGENYSAYIIPVSELMAIMKDGTEITFNLYEKRKTEIPVVEEEILPQLQKNLSLFPDFEEQFPSTEAINLEKDEEESASDILQRISLDFLKLAKKLK